MIYKSLAECISRYGEKNLFVMNENNKVLHWERAIYKNNLDYLQIKVRLILQVSGKTKFVAYLNDNINNYYIKRALML